MTDRSVLRADPAILRLHADAQEYASAVNSSIATAHGGVSPHPLSSGALYALTSDLFGMHRAVLSLCKDGWAFTAVPLLRSMMDLLLSAAVITEQEQDAEYRGFKYTYFFLKAELNETALSASARAAVRARIEEGIKLLPSEHQPRARDFMFKERMGGTGTALSSGDPRTFWTDFRLRTSVPSMTHIQAVRMVATAGCAF